jgi:histidyl-tRNA synthetase
VAGAGKVQAPKGTFDVLPPDAERRRALADSAAGLLGRAGYGEFETPVFEHTEVFSRGVGAATDIVQKEMFTFEDQGGRSLTLRPEGTAPICRAYAEHGMHKLPQPVRLWYLGPFFRHEAPQAGRFRQFTQIGAEALGSEDPSIDAELILLLADLFEAVGVGPVRLRLSSLANADTRRAYAEELREYLRQHEDQLSEEVRARLDLNPLRAFDSDHPGTREAVAGAPRLIDRLEPDDAEHFQRVRELLDEAGLEYELDGTLVRGLDYYTRTVFEFESERLGAQNALGGGGRYDGLVEQLGGPPTPGVGWAAGVERILMAAGEPERPAESRTVFISYASPAHQRRAFALLRALRAEGLAAEMEQAGRSLKGQFKHADRLGARAVVIVGDDVEVKDMKTGEQAPAADPVARVMELLR